LAYASGLWIIAVAAFHSEPASRATGEVWGDRFRQNYKPPPKPHRNARMGVEGWTRWV